jgi:hypothetical protein
MQIIIILLLVIIIILLSATLFVFSKKCFFLSQKEKEFLIFVIDIFNQYGEEIGIQSKDQHQKLVEELDKIKNKFNNKII